MKPDALIVIDVQTALVEAHPYREEALIHHLQTLLAACRAGGVPVIYVRHGEDEEGGLNPGTPGWEIAAAIAPQKGEPVFDKRYNSAFRGTGLHGHLQAMGAQNLLICGMQVEYCVDTTIKVAFELGYHVTVPRDATGTFDNDILPAEKIVSFYENNVWHGELATVVPMEDALASIRG